jgi:hypothetical protein
MDDLGGGKSPLVFVMVVVDVGIDLSCTDFLIPI